MSNRLPPAQSPDTQARNGSQSLQRAFALLRAVADAGPEGIWLTEIARRTDMHVATAHRLLAALQRERAVSFDPYARVYHIGYDFLRREEESRDIAIRRHFGPLVRRLADVTGDVIYLYIQQGLNALCIDSARGNFPTRELPLGIGGRRPLGIGAGSLVLLAALPVKDLNATLDANAGRYARYTGLGMRQIKAMLRDYRRDGYLFHPGYVLPGVCGLGVPLYDEAGQVVAAIGLSAEYERLATARKERVARTMLTEASRMGSLRVWRA